jgi:Flp pilus assembly pilin Flp
MPEAVIRLAGTTKGGESVLLDLYTRIQTAWLSFRSRFENEDGVIATEYIIMLVLVALAIIAGATYLGIKINSKLSAAGDSVGGIAP